jgi:hypothetical protein
LRSVFVSGILTSDLGLIVPIGSATQSSGVARGQPAAELSRSAANQLALTMLIPLDQVVDLLQRDLVRTIGEAHRVLVVKTVERVGQLDIADPGAKIVDDVQQALHDTFVDTSWPACPRHARHPLWFREGAWWCEHDAVAIARLGELPMTGAQP